MGRPIDMLFREQPCIKKAIKAQGWSVEMTKGMHIKFISPTGEKVFASGTPGDRRAQKNVMTELRHHGLLV